MRRLIAVGLMLLVAAPALAAALELPITVQEPAGVARVSAPVCGGIPLPWGTFKKGQPFALFDGSKEIPLQALPLVVDGQGYLRWILLDFQTDIGAKEKKTFTLKAVKPQAKPAQTVGIKLDGAGGMTVNTGKVAIRIAIDKPLGLFSGVRAGGRDVVSGASATYTDATRMTTEDDKLVREFKTYKAGVPAKITVEYEGPMRVTIKATGRFVGDDDTKMLYIARFTAWAGKSEVLVKYTLANSNPDHYAYRKIKDSSLILDLTGKPDKTFIGASKTIETGPEGWLHQGLWAGVKGSAKAGVGNIEKWASADKEYAAGWLAAKTSNGAVAAADLYFRDNSPRRIESLNGNLVLHGITDRYDGVKDRRGRMRGAPWATDHLILMDSTHYSSQYLIDFAAAADAAGVGEMTTRGKSDLHAMAPPRWYFDTKGLAVGQFATQADEIKCYKTWGWTHDPKRAPKAPGYKITKGRYVHRADNHYDTEEDVSEALLLMYLRTGSRSFYRAAKAWNNYNMDLQQFRTDGWRYKDGAVWWNRGGPAGGNRPQRQTDPVTGWRNGLPKAWSKPHTKRGIRWTKTDFQEINALSISKQCYCHNYAAGLAGWYCITGDRDALEAAVDSVEQNIDSQKRSKGKIIGKANSFSRDFTRSAYLINATRLAAPTDEFVVEASDYLTQVYLKRPRPEPRGFVNPQATVGKARKQVNPAKAIAGFKAYVGVNGIKEMKRLGVTVDSESGALVDPKTKAKWHPLYNPHTWMFTYLPGALDCYLRQSPNEDVQDWVIAYGQAVARVLYQEKHQNLSYGKFLVDFPVKGFAWDPASWALPDDSKLGKGVSINGYLARFHPDICARAYMLSGESFLKQRAYDFWNGGSHRGYNAKSHRNVGKVGTWANVVGVHDETVCMTGRTFYVWAYPRKDGLAPHPVKDLSVALNGDGSGGLAAGQATISFSAPADQAGGKVVRYQVKCSDKPIVGYQDFLDAWKQDKDREVRNWWMATNLTGELAPKRAGAKEAFAVTGVPKGAKYFAVRSFDDSSNRSPMSNIAHAK
jgi:exo-rhamnogalacturonan lyase-like protein